MRQFLIASALAAGLIALWAAIVPLTAQPAPAKRPWRLRRCRRHCSSAAGLMALTEAAPRHSPARWCLMTLTSGRRGSARSSAQPRPIFWQGWPAAPDGVSQLTALSRRSM